MTETKERMVYDGPSDINRLADEMRENLKNAETLVNKLFKRKEELTEQIGIDNGHLEQLMDQTKNAKLKTNFYGIFVFSLIVIFVAIVAYFIRPSKIRQMMNE